MTRRKMRSVLASFALIAIFLISGRAFADLSGSWILYTDWVQMPITGEQQIDIKMVTLNYGTLVLGSGTTGWIYKASPAVVIIDLGDGIARFYGLHHKDGAAGGVMMNVASNWGSWHMIKGELKDFDASGEEVILGQ